MVALFPGTLSRREGRNIAMLIDDGHVGGSLLMLSSYLSSQEYGPDKLYMTKSSPGSLRYSFPRDSFCISGHHASSSLLMPAVPCDVPL